MKLQRLRSFEGYPEQCCLAEEGGCGGTIHPYVGERDSFGYEVVGFCDAHYEQQRMETQPCDNCGAESTHLRFSAQSLGMLCRECYNADYCDDE